MRKLTCVLMPFLLLGCGEEPATPNFDKGPSFNFMNGPDIPGGSNIFRVQGIPFTFSWDPDRDVLAAHFQADNAPFCGGEPFALWDLQAVNNQDDVYRTLWQLRDAPIFIYRFSDPEPDFCKLLLENWLYQGTHSMSFTDNDFFDAAPGAESFNLMGHGTVFDRDGKRYHYTEHQNGLIAPDGTYRVINEDILITTQGN